MSYEITIRKSTPQEQVERVEPIVVGGPRPEVPTYVVVSVETDRLCLVFGLPQGGESRGEALYWAERMVSKNGFDLVLPSGWKNVKAKAPK